MSGHNTHKHTISIFILSLTFLTVLSGIILSGPKASADSSAGITVSVTVPAVCSLTANSDSVSNTIYPGNSGLIGTSTIKAICNDPAGLAVYAIGYTDDTTGNTNLVSTVGGTTNTIHTNVTASGTPASSEWYMTINPVSGTYAPTIVSTFENIANAIPQQYTKVAYRNTATDMGANANGANFTAAFNAYIASNQPAGTYTGKVKFLLVHPHVLTYDSQTGQPDTVQPAVSVCEPGVPLLQDVLSWGSSVALGETVEAIDSRDCQAYKVKRLKMNAAGTKTALWMGNLNLGAEPLVVNELNDTNTHLASGVSAIPAATFTSWIETTGIINDYTSASLVSVKSSNTCEVYDAQLDDYIFVSCPEQDSYGNKYGTIYNYTAASAGTYAYASGSGTANASSDLCPSGWRMPTGGPTGELQTIVDAYELSDGNNGYADANGFTTIQQTLGFSLAGGSYEGELYSQGSYGIYWSSTIDNGYGMYMLGIIENTLNLEYSSRNSGNSLRCIEQPLLLPFPPGQQN